MALSTLKRQMIRDECLAHIRAALEVDPNTSIIDFDLRRSPGPISDAEWEEWISSAPRLAARRLVLIDRTTRRFRIVR